MLFLTFFMRIKKTYETFYIILLFEKLSPLDIELDLKRKIKVCVCLKKRKMAYREIKWPLC